MKNYCGRITTCVAITLMMTSATHALSQQHGSHNCQDDPNSQICYVFSHFRGEGEDGLHLAYSYDGLTWKPLKNGNALLRPKVGRDKLMRDPCIISGPDGRFHMVWTVSWREKARKYQKYYRHLFSLSEAGGYGTTYISELPSQQWLIQDTASNRNTNGPPSTSGTGTNC